MGAERVNLGSEKGLRTEHGAQGPRRQELELREGSRRVRGMRASLAHTQEALENSRGLHLLPQIQGREKVEPLLRDNGRAGRFCGSPRAPLGLAHCRLILSPRPRRRLPGPEAGQAGSRSGLGPTASPSQRLAVLWGPAPQGTPSTCGSPQTPPVLGLGSGPLGSHFSPTQRPRLLGTPTQAFLLSPPGRPSEPEGLPSAPVSPARQQAPRCRLSPVPCPALPGRPPVPSRGLPGFDPARTRGPAPHGCRAIGGRRTVAPQRRLLPRASGPCGSSGHS